MEFLAAFPDAEFDLSRYLLSTDDQDHDHHFFLSQIGQQVSSLPQAGQGDHIAIGWNNDLKNQSPSSNCSSNNSTSAAAPNFDCHQEITTSYYGGDQYQYQHQHHHNNYANNFHSANYVNNLHEAANNNPDLSSAANTHFPFPEFAAVETAHDVPALDCHQLKRKRSNVVLESQLPIIAPSDKKRARATNNKSKRPSIKANANAHAKNKSVKCIADNEEERNFNNNVVMINPSGQSSSSCNSEEENNACQEYSDNNNITNNNNGDDHSLVVGSDEAPKSRASRGSATDPQSLYARKRRERINERLRMLQNLVPNGTKVDISTMLEEAVHYVKFLQIQIKLLSSDDMWMYAPIAYNGVDVGLNEKFANLL